MKILGAIALTSAFLLPNLALAACVDKGATVVYLNGILTSEDRAKTDLDALRRKYISQTGDLTIDFINGYNPSHVEGVADFAEAAAQTLDSSISNLDRDTILLQIHPQVTTRKLVLVGHSQGALYANEIYDYLLAHGEPKAAVGVYQVGSPASYVAGGGTYLTSSNDSIINGARLLAAEAVRGLAPLAAAGTVKGKALLPANIALSASGNGHGFSDVYLAEAPGRIVGDLQKTLAKLKPEAATDTGECFTPPSGGLGYQTAKAGLAVADVTATGVKAGVAGAHKFGAAVGDAFLAAATGALGLGKKIVQDIGITAGGAANLGKASTDEVRPTNFDILSKLYGSSLTKDDVAELLGQQGSAVATAPVFAESAPLPPQRDVPGAEVEQDPAPSVKKTTYLGGHKSRSSNAGSEESAEQSAEPVPEQTPEQEAATTTEPVATTTEPATSTEPVATTTEPVEELPAVTSGSPVEDSFDAFNNRNWQTRYTTYNTLVLFRQESDASLCRSGGCVVGRGSFGGLIGGGYRPFMYATGSAVAQGAATVWANSKMGWRQPRYYFNACLTGGSCFSKNIGLVDDTSPDGAWHQYYVAWRQGTTSLETCTLRDSTDPAQCGWVATSHPRGTAVDGFLLSGDVARDDLGDRIWFDDLQAAVY